MDFVCVEAKLIVELDGETHDADHQKTKDVDRDAWFARQGWRILRFSNELVLSGGDLVVEQVKRGLA